MANLRWGIIGPGRIAPRLVRALSESRRGELVAVASRNAERAEAFASEHAIGRSFDSYDALLRDPDVDVVYVALPNHLHAQWTVRALEAGKHVLCEKPLALSVPEVDEIIAASRRTGRTAVEGFMYLHHPQTIQALELARSGALGRLELVIGTFSFLLTQPNDPRIDPQMGGGSLWDVGCYPVSLARTIAREEPESVNAFARFDERGSTVPLSVSFGFRMVCSHSSTVGSRRLIASGWRSWAATPYWSLTRRSCLSRTARAHQLSRGAGAIRLPSKFPASTNTSPRSRTSCRSSWTAASRG